MLTEARGGGGRWWTGGLLGSSCASVLAGAGGAAHCYLRLPTGHLGRQKAPWPPWEHIQWPEVMLSRVPSGWEMPLLMFAKHHRVHHGIKNLLPAQRMQVTRLLWWKLFSFWPKGPEKGLNLPKWFSWSMIFPSFPHLLTAYEADASTLPPCQGRRDLSSCSQAMSIYSIIFQTALTTLVVYRKFMMSLLHMCCGE